jgi:hypothetical protein
VNTRHEVLNWFGLSREVIALRPVLMYYAVEIGSPIFLSGSFRVFPKMLSLSFFLVLDVDLSSLFIVKEPFYRV